MEDSTGNANSKRNQRKNSNQESGNLKKEENINKN